MAYTVNIAVSNAASINSGGNRINSWELDVTLPTGLSFNTTSGLISGTPSVLTERTAYTVTAINTGGTSTTVLYLTIIDVPPSLLSYATNPAVYTLGVDVTNSPTYAGGPAVSFSLASGQTLPSGLSLSPSTGVLSGTPIALASQFAYTVTATNSGGSATAVPAHSD